MATIVNRAKMTTATTGTGTITLGTATAGFQTFAAAGVTNGLVVRYVIEDGTSWELGSGTYTSSGTTLTRTPTESSSGGAAISLSGAAVVFVTPAAVDLVPYDGTAVALTYGGTGATTAAGARTNLGLGTMAVQFSSNVNITGGTIDGVTLGATTASTAKVTTLQVTSSIQEAVYVVTGTTPILRPTNGTIQTWTLTAASTPSFVTNTGDSLTLMIDDGAAYPITWPAITWVNNGGVAPTLSTTGYTVVVIWDTAAVRYGALVGNGQ